MTDTKTAFVTGGSGFLGRHIIDLLQAEDWQVIAMNRPGSDIAHLQNRGLTLVEGDVTDKASIQAAMPDKVTAVFHAAADTSQWSRNDRRQDAVNIGGTQNMVDVALAKQAGRFIHTSSISAYGCQPGTITEETESVAAHSRINYERSKYAAEQVIRDGITRGLDAVILNPSAIIGPADTNNWARSFFIARDGGIPGAPSGATSMCDVREVAKAHLRAFDRAACGENFLLGGTAVPYRDMMEEISRLVGNELNLRPVPAIFLKIFARWNLLVERFTGKEPDITPEIAFLMSQMQECSCAKAKAELDYVDRDWRESVRASFDWLVDEGLLVL